MMKLLITTHNGKIKIINSNTGEELKNLGRVDFNVNSFGKVSISIEFKDINVHINAESV